MMATVKFAACAVGLLMLPAVAAPAAPDSADAVEGGTLVVAVATDPETLNGAMTTSSAVQFVTGSIFDSLVIHDAEGNPTPNLATSWEVSEDALTTTFNLVDNATWHDGEPFTSEDVKFTAEEVWSQFHSRNSQALRNLDRVETPDPHTVVFHFTEPYAALVASVGKYDGNIIPKHIYEGTDVAKNPHNLEDPIGTGPFKLEEWTPGSQLRLTKNEDYWKAGQPYLDEVIFTIIPDPSARAVALESGEVDLIPNAALPPYSEFARLQGSENVTVHEASNVVLAGTMALTFNLRRDITGDPLVRQALAHVIDRELLVERVLFGHGRVADGPFSPPWYDDDAVTKYPVDPAEAERLLDEAGYESDSNGQRFSLSLRYDQGRNATARAAEVIREQLSEIGVEIELIGTDRATSEQAIFMDHDFDLAIPAEFVGTGPDPAVGIANWHVSSNIGEGLFNNAAAYENEIVDDALTRAATQSDPEARQELFSTAQSEITTDLPYLWLMSPNGAIIYNDRYANVGWTDPYELDLASVYVRGESSDAAGNGGANLVLIGGLVLLGLALIGGLIGWRRRRLHADVD